MENSNCAAVESLVPQKSSVSRGFRKTGGVNCISGFIGSEKLRTHQDSLIKSQLCWFGFEGETKFRDSRTHRKGKRKR